jgi:hypothetical protein
VPEEFKFDTDEPSTKEKTGPEVLKEKAKDVAKDTIQDLADELLKPSDSEQGTRSRDDPATTRSSSRVDGPMCSPSDPSDRGDVSDDDGPIQRTN